MVSALLCTVFEQPDAASSWAQHTRVLDQLHASGFADAAEMLVFTAFAVEHWRQIRSNNPQERLNKELRRRTDVVGIFPDLRSALRLVGADTNLERYRRRRPQLWPTTAQLTSAASCAGAAAH